MKPFTRRRLLLLIIFIVTLAALLLVSWIQSSNEHSVESCAEAIGAPPVSPHTPVSPHKGRGVGGGAVTAALWSTLRANEPGYTALRRVLPFGAARAGFDFPRTPALLDFTDWMARHELSPVRILSFYANDPEIAVLRSRVPDATIDECYFDGTSRCDLHYLDLPLPGDGYDAVIFSQTLEHLYDPLLALTNIFRLVRPGGIVFTSAPTHNIPHMAPAHFQHFTPVGLDSLMRAAGFDVLEIGYWGNARYLHKLYATNSWPDVNDVGSPVENSLRLAAQAWALVRKPADSARRAPVTLRPAWTSTHPRVSASDIAVLYNRLRLDRPPANAPWVTPVAQRALPDWAMLDAGVWAATLALVEAYRGLAPPRIFASTPGASTTFAAVLGVPQGGAHDWTAQAAPIRPPPDMLVIHRYLEFSSEPQDDVEAAAAALAPGGLLWLVAPTILLAADFDGDASPVQRAFTATGLTVAASRAGLNVLTGGAWGSLPYVDGLIDGVTRSVCEIERVRWQWRYWGGGDAPSWPRAAVAWVLARKPTE